MADTYEDLRDLMSEMMLFISFHNAALEESYRRRANRLLSPIYDKLHEPETPVLDG